MVMLRHLCEQLRFLDGTVVQIGGEERAENDLEVPAANYLTEFRLENDLPVWRYQVGETILETRLLLPYMQNTVHITYRVVSRSRTRTAGAASINALPRARGPDEHAIPGALYAEH